MFLGINMFLALLRAHFNPRYARAKMILSRAKNIFMPANVNSIVILHVLYITWQFLRNTLHKIHLMSLTDPPISDSLQITKTIKLCRPYHAGLPDFLNN